MNARKKLLVETALVVVLGGGLAVAGGAVAGALPALNVPGLDAVSGLTAVGDHSPPVGDHSPPVGDDSAPKPHDDKDADGKDGYDGKDDDGFDKDKYYESKDAHGEG